MKKHEQTFVANTVVLFARMVLVVAAWDSESYMQKGFAVLGFIAIVTTLWSWTYGKVDFSWRGFGVGLAYLPPLLFRGSSEMSVLFWLGFGIQIWSKAYLLHRCTVTAPVFVSLAARGPYRFLRHPMSLGEALMAVSFFVAVPTFWNYGICMVCLASKVYCIWMEERFLRLHREYRDYCREVKWRLVYGIW